MVLLRAAIDGSTSCKLLGQLVRLLILHKLTKINLGFRINVQGDRLLWVKEFGLGDDGTDLVVSLFLHQGGGWGLGTIVLQLDQGRKLEGDILCLLLRISSIERGRILHGGLDHQLQIIEVVPLYRNWLGLRFMGACHWVVSREILNL